MRSAVKNLKRASGERAKYELCWKLQGGMVVTDGSARYWLRIMLPDVDETMGFLLALALSVFSLPGLFTTVRGVQGDDL